MCSRNSTNDRTIPVAMSVPLPPIADQAPPVLYYRGILDSGTLTTGASIAAGELTTAYGQQLSGGTVLVNGVEAPVLESTFGRIVFQMPSTISGIARAQAVRDGQASNTVVANVAPQSPKIVAVTDSGYAPRDLIHPARPGETLIIWATGLGATIPAVPDGVPSPGDPPAVVVTAPVVRCFGVLERDLTPEFAGLSPGAIGLYQVTVTLPAETPAGMLSLLLSTPGPANNRYPIRID
jgi:uncharacterized protein (TIGR03437 family)